MRGNKLMKLNKFACTEPTKDELMAPPKTIPGISKTPLLISGQMLSLSLGRDQSTLSGAKNNNFEKRTDGTGEGSN